MGKIIEVSIIILTKDKVEYLKPCVESIFKKNKRLSFEIIIISNNSEEKATSDYFEYIEQEKNVRVVCRDIDFNYAALNNYGASIAKGEYLLFLNNDTEFISNEGVNELKEICSNQKVGSVGATLLYENHTIQHVGVAIGESGAWHAYQYANLNDVENINVNRECTAVTGACLMMKKELFQKIKGFDEYLRVIYNDIDLGLKIAELGYKNICSTVQLYHYENITRGKTPYEDDRQYFINRWKPLLDTGDKYNRSEIFSSKFIKEKLHSEFNGREVFVWGTGSYANIATRIIRETGFEVSSYVDNNSIMWNTNYQGKLIISPQILESIQNKPYILIASMYYIEIKEQLEEIGYVEKQDFWRVFI